MVINLVGNSVALCNSQAIKIPVVWRQSEIFPKQDGKDIGVFKAIVTSSGGPYVSDVKKENAFGR